MKDKTRDKKQPDTFEKIYFFAVVLIFTIIIFAAIKVEDEITKLAIILPCFAVGMIGGLICWIRKWTFQRKFKNANKNREQIIQEQLNKVFPGATFEEKRGIGRNTFLSSEFVDFGKSTKNGQFFLEKLGLKIPKPQTKEEEERGFFYETDCLISGEYKKVKFYCCNSEYYTYTGKNADKHKEEDKYTLFDGVLMIFDFENKFTEKIKIFEKYNVAMSGSELKKVETESYEMSKKFECRTSDELTFFKIITPEVIEMILKIEEVYPGQVEICFKNGKCYVGLWSKKASLKMNPFASYYENTVRIGKNIVLMKKIIEGFNLCGRIFTSAESRYGTVEEAFNKIEKEEKRVLKNINTWGSDNYWG